MRKFIYYWLISIGLIAPVHLLGQATPGQPLRAGYAKADVTPAEPVRLGGYSLRLGPSEGIHGEDKLYVRAVVFDDGSTRVAFVESDLIGTRQHDVFRQRISQATGIPAENVLLGDAHNHSAPSPSPNEEANWQRQFNRAVISTVKAAVANLQPVRIAAGEGRSRVAMNRRQVRPRDTDSFVTFDENHSSQSFGKFKTDNPERIHESAGVVRIGANPAGPIDEAVQLVRIDTESAKPLSVMIHYACHGTSLGGRNNKVSAEWMGRMQAHVEKQIPGVGAIFLQGAAGDVNPRVVGGLDGYKDDIHTTWALGDEIGAEAARVYRRLSVEPTNGFRIQILAKDILLPRAYRELFQDFRNTMVRVPTTVVRIGQLMWVTFPGEMFNTIGKRVKAACPASHAHLMGYTNGSIGYFTEQKAFAEGGYEPARSHLAPVAEQIYMREITELLTQLR